MGILKDCGAIKEHAPATQTVRGTQCSCGALGFYKNKMGINDLLSFLWKEDDFTCRIECHSNETFIYNLLSTILMNYSDAIIVLLKKHVPENIEIKLETPPNSVLGDFAFPCFALSKIHKKSPQLIAHDLAAKLSGMDPSLLDKVMPNGPYVNFYLNKKNLSTSVLHKIQQQKEKYGQQTYGEKIMVEFSSPNTNKPLHLGHVRNISLGDSISRILSFLGNDVIKGCLVNDRGIHICKSMLAYKKWGHNKNPDKKSDFFVGDFYVLFAKRT